MNVDERERNAASVIGPLGIPYRNVKRVFYGKYATEKATDLAQIRGVTYIKVPSSQAARKIAPGIPKELSSQWKLALSLDMPKSTDFPYVLGEDIASFVASLTAILLRCAGKDAQSLDTESQTTKQDNRKDKRKDNHKDSPKLDNIIKQAFDAEASFISWRDLGSSIGVGEQTSKMGDTIEKLYPHVKRAIRFLLPQIKDFALQLALDQLNNMKNSAQTAKDLGKEKPLPNNDPENQEEFAPFLAPVIGMVAPTIIGEAVKGFSKLLGATEAIEIPTKASDDEKFVKMLAYRVCFGQACQEVISKCKKEELDTEGLIDYITSAYQGALPVAKKYGPKIIGFVGPQVAKFLINQALGKSESIVEPQQSLPSQLEDPEDPKKPIVPEEPDSSEESEDPDEPEVLEEPDNSDASEDRKTWKTQKIEG